MFNHLDRGKWWDRAWSLVNGCTPVSAGCANCWSAAMEARLRRHDGLVDAKGRFNGCVIPMVERLDLPLKTKKPTVFAVWNDLFHKDVPESFIDQALDVMRQSPQHRFFVLTKRPKRMSRFIEYFPYDNVIFMTSVENQETVDERTQYLLGTNAQLRGLSVEPLLGPVELYLSGISWVVAGSETGAGARPAELDWFRDVRDQCAAADVPFFLKNPHTLDGRVHRALPKGWA